MLEGRFVFLLSDALLAEYRTVLLRPAIRRLHRPTDAAVDSILAEPIRNGVVRRPAALPSEEAAVADPHDRHLWELALSEEGAALVTGDQELLARPLGDVRVLAPRELCAMAGL